MMMSGKNWPRPPYLKRASCGNMVPMTAEEIQEKWRVDAASAAVAGTWTHLQVEVLLNGGFVTQQCVELQLFAAFLRTGPKAVAFRTEWVIFGDDERLAGCIDFVAAVGARQVLLFDWKRTKNLRSKYSNPWQRMRPPLSHLDDCAGNCYRLQLNVYRFLVLWLCEVRFLVSACVCFLWPCNELRSRNITASMLWACMWWGRARIMPTRGHLSMRCHAWSRK